MLRTLNICGAHLVRDKEDLDNDMERSQCFKKRLQMADGLVDLFPLGRPFLVQVPKI